MFQRKGSSPRPPRKNYDIYADLQAEGVPGYEAPAPSQPPRTPPRGQPRGLSWSRAPQPTPADAPADAPRGSASQRQRPDQPSPPGPAKGGVLTAIHPSQRREGRFEIYVDGAKVAEITAETIGALSLQTQLKQPISAEVVEALGQAERALATYDRAVMVLSFRSRSVKELRRSLQQKGEPLDLIDLAIEKLVRSGFLSDESYARQFTRAKVSGQGFARRRLEQELSARGVARDTARSAIHEVIEQDHIDESAVLFRLAEKRLRSLARLEPEVQRRRLYGFLARRGHPHEAISKVMKRLVQGTRAEDLDTLDGSEPE